MTFHRKIAWINDENEIAKQNEWRMKNEPKKKKKIDSSNAVQATHKKAYKEESTVRQNNSVFVMLKPY